MINSRTNTTKNLWTSREMFVLKSYFKQWKCTILKARSWRVVKAKVHKLIIWFSEICLTSLIALFWNFPLMICKFLVLFPHSKNIRMSTLISTSNRMFKREILDKFTEFTFLKFWNFPSERREISKFQEMNEVNFPHVSRMWFLFNHMLQALKEDTRVRITQTTINQYQQI